MEQSALEKKASLLHLSSLKIAEGMKSGSFKSLYRGHGIELSGVREYLLGDDIRSIDWNVTARMARPFVKMFEDERELDVFLIVDNSLSMSTGASGISRIEKACECASLITLASMHNSSPVGAVIFDGNIQFSCAPKSGRDQVMMLLSRFDAMNFERSKGSALDLALTGAGRLLRKRTLVMVFSDFRTDGWLDAFSLLCRRNDVVAVRIADALDDSLPSVGTVSFADPETGVRRVLPTSSQAFFRAWRQDNERRVDLWKKECIKRGGYPLVLDTASDSVGELMRFFTSREQK